MVSSREKAIQDAQFEAYVEGLSDNTRAREAVIDAAKHDEGEFTTFVLDSKNADKVTVYSVVDGTPSQVLVSMLAKQLKKRIPRDEAIPEEFWGKRAFTVDKPTIKDESPKFVCWFHKDSPHRPELDAIGLAGVVCSKRNIPTLVDVEYHVMRKHPQRYKLIEQHRARTRADKTDALRLAEVEAMREQAASTAAMAQALVSANKKTVAAKASEE